MKQCPVCELDVGDFLPYRGRRQAKCPHCGSLERHRFAWLYLKNRIAGKRILHIAPESCLENRFRRVAWHYVGGDLSSGVDVTDLRFEDGVFDVIFCSHVLEHVENDRQAMAEFRRVLSPGGLAVLMVPITEEVTYEDPLMVTTQQRLEAFGQEDHVRRYGLDFVERFAGAGFSVESLLPRDLPDSTERFGITINTGPLFVGN